MEGATDVSRELQPHRKMQAAAKKALLLLSLLNIDRYHCIVWGRAFIMAMPVIASVKTRRAGPAAHPSSS